MEDQYFLNKTHCPRCGGSLNKRIPRNDTHLVTHKKNTIRYWCPCGYYRDEVDIYNHDQIKIISSRSSA